MENSEKVFWLQFDEFQIVNTPHKDISLMWDFLNDSIA